MASPLQVLSGGVSWFAGGRDGSGLTLAYVDTDSSFCAQVRPLLGRMPPQQQCWHAHKLHGLFLKELGWLLPPLSYLGSCWEKGG